MLSLFVYSSITKKNYMLELLLKILSFLKWRAFAKLQISIRPPSPKDIWRALWVVVRSVVWLFICWDAESLQAPPDLPVPVLDQTSVSWLSLDCLLTVSWLSLNCLLTVSWLSLDCLLTGYWLSLDCLWTVSRLSLDCLWKVSKLSLDCLWIVSGLSLDCL